MRFNDEYRKEMNKMTLSDDFIKNLASKMADKAADTDSPDRSISDNIEKEITFTAQKESRTMIGIKVTAVAVAAASVMIVFGAVLKNLPPADNIPVMPDVTQITAVSETVSEEEPVITEKSSETIIPNEISTEIPAARETNITEFVSEETQPQETPEVTADTYDDSYYLENTAEILDAFQVIDSAAAGGLKLEKDENDSYYTDSDQFIKITDNRFAGIEDIREFIDKYTAEGAADQLHKTADNYFTVQNGNLYLKYTPRGYKYLWDYSYEPQITEKSENTFSFIQAYQVPGAVDYAKITMIRSDSHPGWKIISIEDITQ